MKLTKILIACLLGGTTQALFAQKEQKEITVTVENSWTKAKSNEPVVIRLSDLRTAFTVQSAVVRDGDNEIASQLDDLDRDGRADELAFVVDLPARSTKHLKVTLSAAPKSNDYPAKVYAQMKLNDKGKKNPKIQYLSVPGTTAPKEIYSALYHHGPAFESELVAYRLYFDNRQSIDIYGKKLQRLELAESDYYSSPELRKQGYGNDVLWAGKTVSVGSFRGWENDQPQYIDKVTRRSLGILAYGPVRTVVEADDRGWEYQGKSLHMTQHYTLYAGHRDVRVDVVFKGTPVKENTFCTGVMKVEEENVGFLQADGLAGSWGTNLPEKTDTVNNPRETVGLGVCVPQRYVNKTVEDASNYLVIMDTDKGDALSYNLTFCTAKEERGFRTSAAWFAYLKEWQEALRHPCRVSVK